MRRLAIVGSGIAGMGSAYLLRNKFQITIFEKDGRVGGHTNTVSVDDGGHEIPIDTGFMVYNEVTYPNLTRLFAQLQVASKPTDMSFSVQQQSLGYEWSGTGFNRLFGDRSNLLKPRFWRFLFSLDKFNKDALANVDSPGYNELSVSEYVERLGYGEDFLHLYLLPMMSALWSATPDVMLRFPIASLLRFMRSHGLLSVYGQHQWLTVKDGAATYMRKLQAQLPEAVRINQPVRHVQRGLDSDGSVTILTEDGERSTFDKCIVAVHADQALQLAQNCDAEERTVLSSFSYQKNTALLHTHKGVMPRHRANWASWNYLLKPVAAGSQRPETSTHYWMNSLQKVSSRQDYFVSIGGEHLIPESKVLKTIAYEHPIFTVEALKAQERLAALNRRANQSLFFAGSYFRYGFHEDALDSAVQVAAILGGEPGWSVAF